MAASGWINAKEAKKAESAFFFADEIFVIEDCFFRCGQSFKFHDVDGERIESAQTFPERKPFAQIMRDKAFLRPTEKERDSAIGLFSVIRSQRFELAAVVYTPDIMSAIKKQRTFGEDMWMARSSTSTNVFGAMTQPIQPTSRKGNYQVSAIVRHGSPEHASIRLAKIIPK